MSYIYNFNVTLIDQKSPVHAVPVVNGGDIEQSDIATYRLNRPRGRFRENSKDRIMSP